MNEGEHIEVSLATCAMKPPHVVELIGGDGTFVKSPQWPGLHLRNVELRKLVLRISVCMFEVSS